MTLADVEWLSEIFNDMKHHTLSQTRLWCATTSCTSVLISI